MRAISTALFMAVLGAALPLRADTVTVVNTSDTVNGNVSSISALKADPGPDGISFREALLAANNTPGANTIAFDIPPGDSGFDPATGRWIITPATPYPDLTVGFLTIDGDSQTLNYGDTNPDGPEIAFSGSAGAGGAFLSLASPGNGVTSITAEDFDTGIAVPGNGNIIGPGNEFVHNGNGIIVKGDANVVRNNPRISNNQVNGILVEGGTNNSLLANTIENNNVGIIIRGGASGNTAGPDNTISHNTTGVVVADGGSQRNTITRNAIFANSQAGISLVNGGNSGLPPPAMRYFGGVVKGTASPGSTVEVFLDSASDEERLPGSQGEQYLGEAVADGDGVFGFVVGAPHPFINATVTDPAGNTSMFTPPSRPLLVVSNSGTDRVPGNTVSVIDALGFSRVATIEVGSRPEGIVGSRTGYTHVVNNDSDTVSVILVPLDAGASVTVPVGEEPLAIAAASDFLFVACTGPDPTSVPGTVSLVSTATLSVTGTLTVGRRPATVRRLTIGGKDWIVVPNLYDDNLSVIDPIAPRVERTIPAGDYPSDVCAGRNGLIYVADIGNGKTDGVSVIDFASGRTVARISTGLGPIAIEADPVLGYVAVANSVSGTVAIVDEADGRVVRSIPVGGVPTHLAVVPGKYIYVTDFASSLGGKPGEIKVISLSNLSVVGSIEVGRFPNYIEVLSDSGQNWFTSGIELAASPSAVGPGDAITLGYVVSPGLLDRGDILLGVEASDGTVYALDPAGKTLSPAGPVESVPRAARGFPLSSPASGRIDFRPAGLPPGGYRFIAAVLRPGTNSVVQIARSNGFTVTP